MVHEKLLKKEENLQQSIVVKRKLCEFKCEFIIKLQINRISLLD